MKTTFTFEKKSCLLSGFLFLKQKYNDIGNAEIHGEKIY